MSQQNNVMYVTAAWSLLRGKGGLKHTQLPLPTTRTPFPVSYPFHLHSLPLNRNLFTMSEAEATLQDASLLSLPRPRFDYAYHHRLFQSSTSTKTHPIGIRSGPDITFVVSEEEKYLVDDPIKQRILFECTELLKGIQLEQVLTTHF